jgi:phospholipid/cholesterol/gamma-HCH transport system substrate-binding protein
MIKLKREYKVAITVFVALATLIIGVGFLKGKSLFDGGTVFYGVYSRVDGLTDSSPVYYHGYKIGSVREIEFLPKQEGRFVVAISINKDIPLANNSVAQIYSLDLMGTKAVQFVDGDSGRHLQAGDTVQTSVMGGMKDEVLPIKNKVENLIVKLDTTLSDLSMVFSKKNNNSLEEGMNSFRQMMNNLERSTSELNASLASGGAIHNSLANIDSISQSLSRQRQAIGTTMENVALFSEQLKKMKLDTLAVRIDSSLTAVNSLLHQAKEGEGSLGMMLSDKGLYYNMVDATANLDRLLADMRHNPKRYLNFAESDDPVDDLKNRMIRDKYRIFEDTDGSKYTYTVGSSSSYTEIVEIKNEIISLYPKADVVAMKDGKPLKLEKALKQSEVKN